MASLTLNLAKRSLIASAFILSLCFASTGLAFHFPATGTLNVYFSPNGGATDAVVAEIDSANIR